MFAGLFDNGDFASSHLFVVLCTGLAFLAVQLVLSVRFYFRMRRQERVIHALSQDFELGRTDRREHRARPSNSGWVQWVLANYSADASGKPCNFTRDDALQELDVRIASNGDYLLLQRMGVMAPLLGVVLTVIGFYWLEIGDEQQSLQAIMLAVAPLVSGVGTGAVLALINQALLHVAGHRAETLRMTARKWFDTAIWSQVDLEARAAAGRVVMAMDQLNASLSDAAARYAHGAGQIGESTASMSQAASHFQETVQSFSAAIKGVPEALDEVRRATTASAEALEKLIRVGARAVANLDVSVAAFRTTIDREFAAAASLHRRARRALAKSARRYDEAAERISPASQQKSSDSTTQQLAALQEALTGLEVALQAIKDFARPAIDRLDDAQRQPAESNDAISDGADADAQSGFTPSLARRPR